MRATAHPDGPRSLACLMLRAFWGGLTLSLASAQAGAGQEGGAGARIGAMATVALSQLRPGPLGERPIEAYLTQPMVVASAGAGGRFFAAAMVNFEAVTLRRGELNHGVYGESFIDRRHPHTWLHELMAGVEWRRGSLSWSLHTGKGFVPFGSDDPAARPFVKFPVNHHHAQILERLQAGAALRVGRLVIEAAAFNGDEPEGPTDWPNSNRILDSWSVRSTWTAGTIEVSAGRANVRSPEFAAGGGLDQRKTTASLRHAGSGRLDYWLVEAARTAEFDDRRRAFTFHSVLGEARWSLPGVSLAARLERTDRPEEERTESLFRSVRPIHDFNILGTTRWHMASVHATRMFGRRVRSSPFLEVSLAAPRALSRLTALDPTDLFGASRLWSVTVGWRLHSGVMPGRVGRYGAAVPMPTSHQH